MNLPRPFSFRFSTLTLVATPAGRRVNVTLDRPTAFSPMVW